MKKICVFFLMQTLFTGLISFECLAILPKSQAQIQANENDFSRGVVNDIGSVLDEHDRGATATQSLTQRNTTLNASATTQVDNVGRSLRLLVSISQTTSADSTPSGGFSPTASYSVQASAAFRDIIHIKADKNYPDAVMHLVFGLTGGPISTNATNSGATVTGGVGFSINGFDKGGGTANTNGGSLGVFNGASQTFDVSFATSIDNSIHEAKEVQLDALLRISTVIPTFYAAINSADYFTGGQGVILNDAYITDGNVRVSGVNIFGESGYIYAGQPTGIEGHYTVKDKLKHITFSADISDDVDDNSFLEQAQRLAGFDIVIDGSKLEGEGNVTGVGAITFGENKAKSIKFKQKNKPTITLTMSVKKKGDDYQLVGKVKVSGEAGSRQFVAKQKKVKD